MQFPTYVAIGTIEIHQQDGLYSLNDLHQASGGEAKHRPNYFLGTEQTQALIAEIHKAGNPAFKTVRGKYASTYGCKELVIAYANWISAAFHLKVIRVFLDSVQPQPAPLPPPPVRTRTLTFTVPEGDTGQRWLLHTDRMGREIVTPLLPETVIATPDRLVKMFIKTPDKLHMSPEQHMTVIGAALHHLVSPAIGA